MIFGFGLLWLKKPDVPTKFFVLFSLAAGGLIAIIGYLAVPMDLILRIASLFAPFIALCFALSCLWLASRWRYAPNAVAIVLALLVFTALIAPWGSLWAPVHFYDPEVSRLQAGEHSTNWRHVDSFFDEHVDYVNVSQLQTDDILILSLIVPSGELSKTRSMQLTTVSISGNTMVVGLKYLGTPVAPARYVELESRLKAETGYALIYNDGDHSIWRSE